MPEKKRKQPRQSVLEDADAQQATARPSRGGGRKSAASKRSKAPAASTRRSQPAEASRHGAPVAAPGSVTRGVHNGLNWLNAIAEGCRRLGIWGVTAGMVLVALVALMVVAHQRRPALETVPAYVNFQSVSGPDLPDAVVWRIIKPFVRQHRAELEDPDQATLAAFYDYLDSDRHAVIKEVVSTGQRLVERNGVTQREISIRCVVRRPYLPVIHHGDRYWVDEEGVLLVDDLPAPAVQRPPLLHFEAVDDQAVVGMAIELWRLLADTPASDRVTAIDLAGPLTNGERGVVLHLDEGPRVEFGRPEDLAYILVPDRGSKLGHKVRQLLHTLESHGDLSLLERVSVRFDEPTYTLASR